MEATTPRRLLLIDDEAMVRTMLTDVLESFGYRVDAAESGEAALERFHAGQYDAVITDLVMPGMNGLEAAERLREFDSVHEARRAGLKVVYKPVSLSGLKAVVETACEQTA